MQAKENKKQTDHTRLYPEGKGHHLTEDSFREEVANIAQRQQEKAAAQKKGSAKRAKRKEMQKAVDDLWRIRSEEHKKALITWESECARLRASGIMKKNLPKRPLRTLKQQIMQELKTDSSSDEGSKENGDEESSDNGD